MKRQEPEKMNGQEDDNIKVSEYNIRKDRKVRINKRTRT